MSCVRLTDISQYQDVVERYRRPGCVTNDYLQQRAALLVEQGRLYADCHENNAYLFEQKVTCSRMYYYLNSLADNDGINAPDGVVAVEILYRGEEHFPVAEVDFLVSKGFCQHLIRDQYAATFKDLSPADLGNGDVKVRPASDIDEVDWACKLFNTTFDHYSGDFIPQQDYQALADDNRILMATDIEGNRLGALHQTIERNVAWISHIAVVPEARGQHAGQALLDAFVENNHLTDKSRYMLWVQQQNAAAVAMYKKKGFRYLNKSTLSLIKQQ